MFFLSNQIFSQRKFIRENKCVISVSTVGIIFFLSFSLFISAQGCLCLCITVYVVIRNRPCIISWSTGGRGDIANIVFLVILVGGQREKRRNVCGVLHTAVYDYFW